LARHMPHWVPEVSCIIEPTLRPATFLPRNHLHRKWPCSDCVQCARKQQQQLRPTEDHGVARTTELSVPRQQQQQLRPTEDHSVARTTELSVPGSHSSFDHPKTEALPARLSSVCHSSSRFVQPRTEALTAQLHSVCQAAAAASSNRGLVDDLKFPILNVIHIIIPSPEQ
jgi:hypothetical protein